MILNEPLESNEQGLRHPHWDSKLLVQGEHTMPLTLRPGKPEDATMCGTICYDAFNAIAEEHNFPPTFPSAGG